jgi:disulfide bond formation protein DsbB
MLQALQSARVVSCTEASWRLLGLSFAGWNVVASGVVAVLALIAAVLSRKAKKEA